MATCIKCGTQLPDGAAFCGNCGTAQNAQQNTQPQGAGAPQMQPQPQMQSQAPQYGGQPQYDQQPQYTQPAVQKKKGSRGLIIAVAGVAVALIVLVVAGVMVFRGSSGDKTTDVTKEELRDAKEKRRNNKEKQRSDKEDRTLTDGNGTAQEPVQDAELLEISFESVWTGTYEITNFRGASQPVLWDGMPVPLEGEAVVFFGLNEGDKVIGITIVDENDPGTVSPFMIARAAVRPDGSLMPVVDENESIENNLLYDRKMTEEEAEAYVIYRDSEGVHFELDYDDGTVSFYATFLLTEEIYSE